MRVTILKYGFVFCWLVLASSFSWSQSKGVDTNFVKPFSKENVVEAYQGVYSSNFIFTSPHIRNRNFRLQSNSSAYAGIYFGYKWLAINFSAAIPGTQLDRNIRLRYNSFSFRFGTNQFSFRPFFNSYNGLLIPEKRRGREFLPFKDIQLTNAGTDVFYFANDKTFSYKAGAFFSKLQVKSAGSFIAGITPLWQSIKWKTPSRELIDDSATYNLLTSQPEWVSLTARLGYTYNFVFDRGKWSIAPVLLLGAGGLHELNTTQQSFHAISDIQASITAGYNGNNVYCYVGARWDNLRSNLFVKQLEQRNADVSITFGYRFGNAKKKIMGIL